MVGASRHKGILKRMLKKNTISKRYSPQDIDDLKAVLPPVTDCVEMEKTSTTSFSSPCPHCGGKNRFNHSATSGRSWCRVCKPEKESMDPIAFHCWRYNKTIKDLFNQYLPGRKPGKEKTDQQSPGKRKDPQEKPVQGQDQDINIQATWDHYLGLCTIFSGAYQLLCDVRKISKETVKKLIDAKGAICILHAQCRFLNTSFCIQEKIFFV